MDEDLQFHARHLFTDLADFLQRQLAGKDRTGQPLLAPELDAGPVHRVGLDRKVNGHLGEMLANQHDQAWIGHDQRIRAHRHHRLQVLDEGAQLGVVWRNVDHHIELLALGVRFINAQTQVGVIELVVAHAQAVARLPGIDRVGAVGKGVAHGFQGAGGRQQFGARVGHGAVALYTDKKCADSTELARAFRPVRSIRWRTPAAGPSHF